MFQGRSLQQRSLRLYQILILFFVTSFIAGCNIHHSTAKQPPLTAKQQGIVMGSLAGIGIGAFVGGELLPFTAAIGGIMGGSISQQIAHKSSVADRLGNQGVLVFHVGDEYRLLLSSDRFFVGNTARLNAGQLHTLDELAEFLRGLDKIEVEVAGYTDDQGVEWQQRALSRQRAQNLSKYLWKQGVDTRLLYATGYGASDPIAKNSTQDGQALNRRIELRFRELHG